MELVYLFLLYVYMSLLKYNCYHFESNESREERSGDKINLEVGSFSESWKTGLRISYQFSTKVSGGLRYEYRESDTRTTGRKIDRDFGFDVNLAISG